MAAAAGVATRSDQSTVRAVVALFVLFGLAARVWMLLTRMGGLDADEGIVGLMARDILDGDFPLFYWGQPYGGPHEPLLTAGFFAVFGASTVVLKVVAILLSGAACVLVWRVGTRIMGETAAIAAALLFWVWPAAFVWWSVKSRGFYHVALVIGLAVVLLVLRLAQRESVLDMALLGALVGTGIWCTPQTVLLTGPALLWLAIRRPSLLRLAPVAAAAGAVAAFPFWDYNLETGWVSFEASQATLAGYGERLRGIFATGLPGALGLRLPDGSRWIAGGLGVAWYVGLLALFAAAIAREVFARRARDERRPARILLLATAGAYPFVLALSPYSAFVDHPRYLYYLGALCALLVAGALAALRPWALVAALVFAMTLTTVALTTSNREHAFYPASEGALIPEDLGPLVDYLVEHDVDHVYADYWLAYYLSFQTGERIVATPYRGALRDEEADQRVRMYPRPGYLFVAGAASEPAFGTEVDEANLPHRRVEVGGFVLYALEENVPPELFPATQAAQP
ncbi:MAG TPA: glycosyltransferase family 39 protein [Actinomycetota bacterium]|nr:glycosyltransferase family 39 protein [Actinomycetota bacterium]